MSAMQRVKTWSDGKKWVMRVVGSIIIVFIAFIASGANDGRQALKKTCELSDEIEVHKKDTNATVSNLNERAARTETKVDMILEILRKKDK